MIERWTTTKSVCTTTDVPGQVSRSLCFALALMLGCGRTREPASTATESAASKPQATFAESAAPIAIPQARQPLAGVLAGGPPSSANLRDAKASGYRTVVSLLPEADTATEAATAEQLGLRFVSIPIASATDLSVDNARRLGETLQDENKPLILHCGTGNRAGALLALWAFHVNGLPADRALELGLSAGLTGLRPDVEQRLGILEPPAAP